MATLIGIPTGLAVATYLGRQSDTVFVAQCNAIVALTLSAAASYTRDVGFEDPVYVPDDIYAAVMSRAARTAVNPLGYQTDSVDTVTMQDRWAGDWNIGERRILNRYRERAK